MPNRAVVVGGSVGGLFAAIALRDAGWDVQICERSVKSLSNRGAGLVLQPEVARFLTRYCKANVDDVSILSTCRQYLSKDGSVKHVEHNQQKMTSWAAVYRQLKGTFPDKRYLPGMKLVGLRHKPGKVTVYFENGAEKDCELLVCADGLSSACRRYLLPNAEPRYAGYVAWRGVVDESCVAPGTVAVLENKFTFFQTTGTHILCYMIPGRNGEIVKGMRRINWVWYCNVPSTGLGELMTDETGAMREFFVAITKQHFLKNQKELAASVLPEVFHDLVERTPQMFVQPIYDASSSQMAFGRIVLVGDAAFTTRPHTAAGVSKAAKNARTLVEAVKNGVVDDLEDRLAASWDEDQVQYGFYLEEVGVTLGNRCQFGRAHRKPPG